MKVAVTVCIFVLGAVCSARPSHHGGRRQGGRSPGGRQGGLFGGDGKVVLEKATMKYARWSAIYFKLF